MVKLICPHCGSDEVRADYSCEWNVERQEWEATGDQNGPLLCGDCGEEFDKAVEEVA